MKLTVLDGHALNPGDLSWDCIKVLADEFSVYDRTPQELVSDRIGDSDCILLNKINITEEVIKKCPKLRYIGVLATGYNVIDTQACRKAGITVTNIPSYSTNAVAQHVFAFILNITNQVQLHCDSVNKGDWIKNPDFCYWKNPLTELSGKTIGIYGFGNIGRQVAKIAHAFGMNVVIHVHNEKSFTGGEKTVSAEEMFRKADFITLHAPLTSETKELINAETISLMKPSAVVINTARGGLINEEDVKKALLEKKISAYCADVVLAEPMAKDNPLQNVLGCYITPHLAWAPLETRQRLLDIAVANLKAYLNGKPENVVN